MMLFLDMIVAPVFIGVGILMFLIPALLVIVAIALVIRAVVRRKQQEAMKTHLEYLAQQAQTPARQPQPAKQPLPEDLKPMDALDTLAPDPPEEPRKPWDPEREIKRR